jgi:hypothetical protein
MLQNRVDAAALPPPPGIIGSLRAGFDAIAAHIGLILMPLALDLLLWLGPHLSVSRLMHPVLDEMTRLAPSSGLPQTDIASMMDMYRDLLGRLNLLSALRTLPIGIPSLLSGSLPIASPLSLPTVVQLDSVPRVLALWILFTLAGWCLGGLYFKQVAFLVASRGGPVGPTPVGRALVQTVLYSLVCLALIWSIGLPAMLLVYVVFAINSVLGQGLLLFMGFIALWLLVPFFFSPHGIYLSGQNAFASFLGGFRLARFTLPTSSLFVLTVFLVGMGLNTLWSVPAEDTWILLVGILGHAFITTGLLAASFVYYQDMSVWVQTVLARLKAGMPPHAA